MSYPAVMIDKVMSTTDVAFRQNEMNLFAVANAAGGSAGAAVSTAVTFTTPLPTANYLVTATPNQDGVCYVTSKLTTGFTLVINPRLAANTLAAGTIDVRLCYPL